MFVDSCQFDHEMDFGVYCQQVKPDFQLVCCTSCMTAEVVPGSQVVVSAICSFCGRPVKTGAL